ncbi:hypothetical protein, partial [Salmonella sp. s51228]|uniref:hypothetical protein n=1 Tax=Salmonella sp. s51228 TaxID=3159652 RepID=UPI00397F8FEE
SKPTYLLRSSQIADGPIYNIVIAKQRIWACSTDNIYVIRPNDFTVERVWKAATTDSPLSTFVIGNNSVWTIEQNSSLIQIWDLQKPINRGTI